MDNQELDYKQAFSDCWRALVMLKRDLDKHETKPTFVQFESSTWDEVVKRVEKYSKLPLC